jgi:hypothetical protein
MNFRPGHVVEAEIHRKFGSMVCHDPSASSPEFFLVLSFGRCQFRLTELSVATLQSVIGGDVAGFCLRLLGDRVFYFSVSSPTVGFYELRSLECSY